MLFIPLSLAARWHRTPTNIAQTLYRLKVVSLGYIFPDNSIDLFFSNFRRELRTETRIICALVCSTFVQGPTSLILLSIKKSYGTSCHRRAVAQTCVNDDRLN